MDKIFDVYLAAPYTHENKEIVSMRVEQINLAASWLMRVMEYRVFSPISMSHPIAMAGGLPTDWTYWEKFDKVVIPSCRELLVLSIPGYDASTGVKNEIRIASGANIPVNMLSKSICDYVFEPPIKEFLEKVFLD